MPWEVSVGVTPPLDFSTCVVGFLRGGCSRGGGNWGTLRIPKKDWGTLGNIGED